MAKLKSFRITYRPFSTSDLEASDIVLPARDADAAEADFRQRFPQFLFVEAKEELL